MLASSSEQIETNVMCVQSETHRENTRKEMGKRYTTEAATKRDGIVTLLTTGLEVWNGIKDSDSKMLTEHVNSHYSSLNFNQELICLIFLKKKKNTIFNRQAQAPKEGREEGGRICAFLYLCVCMRERTAKSTELLYSVTKWERKDL